MTTTPAGLPPWTRTTAPEYYGGHPDKQNHMGLGAVDARTDVTAEQIKRLTADLAAAVRTAPFAVITLTTNDTVPAPPQVHAVRMQTGTTSAYVGNNPPAGFPTITRVSDGRIRAVFPTSPIDDYGATAFLDLKGGHGSPRNLPGDLWISPANPNADAYYEAVDVAATDPDGDPLVDIQMTFEVW